MTLTSDCSPTARASTARCSTRGALLSDGLARTEGVAAQLWSSERNPAVEPPPENLIVKVRTGNVAHQEERPPLNPTKYMRHGDHRTAPRRSSSRRSRSRAGRT